MYRASFRQTYAEIKAPTGAWKHTLAGVLFGMGLAGWVLVYIKKCGKLDQYFTKPGELQDTMEMSQKYNGYTNCK